MISLAELQLAFLTGVRDNSDEGILDHIQLHPKLKPRVQLSLYQTNSIATLQKTLKAVYPVCRKLVGHDFFTSMVNRYLNVTPSKSPDLNTYGDTFSDFIQAFEPANTLPFLPDVARLEWAWHHVFGAREEPSFNFEELAKYQAEPENIYFTLPPYSTLLTSPYPLHLIWETNQDDYEGDTAIMLTEGTHYHYLIWRSNLERRIDLLDAKEWRTLNEIAEHKTLAVLCNDTPDYPATEVIALITQFIRQGFISNFKTT